ncbi:MAG: hypothetical protein P8J87_14355 [Verrucomicrobiales bacterium]|nr:hypothetical protein [Verrucomicrobiales bacterium]
MIAALHIDDVDLADLEQQRLDLIDLMFRTPNDDPSYSALTGIINMLDSWSDGQLEN